MEELEPIYKYVLCCMCNRYYKKSQLKCLECNSDARYMISWNFTEKEAEERNQKSVWTKRL